jgi:ribonuclease M5
MKPVCKKVILVEGKYDKIRIESLLDATVFTTEGFGIFRNEEKRSLFRRLAKTRGIVILSDSDGAGKVIRGHLHTLCGKEGITDLYIPPIPGKEKRKAASSKEGLLGVEGIDNETLLQLFQKSGLLEDGKAPLPRYEKNDLYHLGYFGKEDSKAKREQILEKNRLPKTLSSNAFLDVINLLEITL